MGTYCRPPIYRGVFLKDDRGIPMYPLEGKQLAREEIRVIVAEAHVWQKQADLREADLEGANLSGARLGNAILLRAVLEGANLQDAQLRGALLRGANLY